MRRTALVLAASFPFLLVLIALVLGCGRISMPAPPPQSALNARDMGHAAVAAKFLELRDEVDAIYPKNLKVTE